MDLQQTKLSSIVKSILNLQSKIAELSKDSNIQVILAPNLSEQEIANEQNDVISISIEGNSLKLFYSTSLLQKLTQLTCIEGLGAASLVNNPLGHDIQIKLHGLDRTFYCHKRYLTKHSQYFETMFNKNEYTESKQEVISIALIYPDTFETALYFFYTGVIRNEMINSENYFHFSWLADYLMCDELKIALIPEFVWGYHSSKHFRASMFPVDMLEGWMKNVMTRAESEEKTSSRCKRSEMSMKWKRKWLQLCMIWADNSKSQLAVKQAVQIIRKYKLVNEKVLPHLSMYISRCNKEMQQILDPLGVLEFNKWNAC
ncbi:hypothetical protein LOD99_2965 [Oopsacas minuta]|uniref:BTB domain-containing protein n=1 Tax=Oopsacas minuta TaxID=111878 RepID=A0AAV7JZ81_9METZ|nr:hypothetical protein LOD99_2965 [Oopsacas minuta]